MENNVRAITLSLGANDEKMLAKFYQKVTGLDFGLALHPAKSTYHTWISAGQKFNINKKWHADEKLMFHLRVDSLHAFAATVKSSGGKIVADNIALPIDENVFDMFQDNYSKFFKDVSPTANMGMLAIFEDPEGNNFGAIQLEPWAEKLFEGGTRTKFENAEHVMGIKTGEYFAGI